MFCLFSLRAFSAAFVVAVGAARGNWYCYNLVLLCLLILFNQLTDWLLFVSERQFELFFGLAKIRFFFEMDVFSCKNDVRFCFEEQIATADGSGVEGSFDLQVEAFVDEWLHEAGHLVGGEEFEPLGRCGAVDGVDHDLPGAELADNVHPAVEDFGARGVEVVFFAAEHAGLQHEVAVELLEGLDHAGYVVAWRRFVDAGYEVVGGGVDFHNGVVDLGEGLEDLGQVDAGGVGEDGHLGGGGQTVAEGEGVVDDGGELGVEGGLAIAGEGDGVDLGALLLEGEEHALEVAVHFGGGGEDGVGVAILVPTAFAVDAVEVADFALLGQEVDAEGGS